MSHLQAKQVKRFKFQQDLKDNTNLEPPSKQKGLKVSFCAKNKDLLVVESN